MKTFEHAAREHEAVKKAMQACREQQARLREERDRAKANKESGRHKRTFAGGQEGHNQAPSRYHKQKNKSRREP